MIEDRSSAAVERAVGDAQEAAVTDGVRSTPTFILVKVKLNKEWGGKGYNRRELLGSGCETVQSSRYAETAGVPVALLGLAAYGALFATAFASGRSAAAVGAVVALTGRVQRMVSSPRSR